MRLNLTDDSQYSIAEGLRSGAVDIYFASVMADFQLEGIEKRPMAASNQYVLMPRQHPLAGRNSISIRELDGECFILHPETSVSVSDLPFPATPCYFYRTGDQNPEVTAFIRDFSRFVKEARVHEY